MKGAAAVVFVRKVSQGSNFKNDSQFNSNFSILLFHTQKKNFFGVCKSRLYSLDVSTDIPILGSLLVHVH